ncbi:hypothetical protein [Chryseobacterium sp. 2987]|uniref:tetratricopeptide repeat protein n=1 Tax=Chryseobacterium sp. 2987 TaxID=2817767 RepID=UPI00285F33FF|nr:hypothetical protein [Chryseobacterium sp. 2987]MDR6920156.1 Flp pilus assembly protein TadD [Chryseobacterium sp. 2987]
MKKLIAIFSLFISTLLSAQPGYTFTMRQADFERFTQQLKTDPNNDELIWKRLNISFNPQFDIYTKGGKQTYSSTPNFQFNQIFENWTYEKILADINRLIDHKAEVNEYGRNTNLIDFTLLRGKLYYLTGDNKNALSDYLTALNDVSQAASSPNNDEKKKKICISLAAYYYNLTEDSRQENLREALKYIDMISPIEFVCNIESVQSNGEIFDYYQYEKINLLTYLHEDPRLENYYKKLILQSYDLYKKKNEDGLYIFDKINDLANFYFQKKNYEKARRLTEIALNYFPKNSLGYIINRYNVSKHYFLLNRIYRTDGFKNQEKEFNNLIDILGPTHGISYNAKEIGSYIKESLEKYPEEPRLLLALAIWHYKNDFETTTARPEEILKILNKAEESQLKDYRLPFTKAHIYLYKQRNYKLALKEINKSLQLNQSDPHVYGMKSEILRNIPGFDEKEEQLAAQESQSKSKIVRIKDMPELLKEIQ